MKDLQGRSVLILGLGDSGLAMARWCQRCGAAAVQVADTRAQPPQAAALAAELPAVRLHQGLEPERLEGVNLVLKSPGLAPADPQVAPLLARADEWGIPVRGELSLFAAALADLKADRGYAPRVLAITGTNGKTTTTMLTALLVERAGRRVGLAGNVGPTLLDTLATALDHEPVPPPAAQPLDGEPDLPSATGEPAPADCVAADAGPGDADLPAPDALPIAPPPPPAPVFEHLPEVWVLELSSFQLDGVSNFHPDAATVLNLSQDHLDWHGSMQAYGAAKARVFGKQGVLVVNRDDAAVEALVPPPEVIRPAARGKPARTVARKVVRFGLDLPRHPGDFGLSEEAGMAWLVRALESDETVKRRPGDEEEIVLQRLMPADALRIRGRHNAANALAALALATAIGCPLAPMLHGLREYRGEPHRVEPVGSVAGVSFYDDSKGTNVGATEAAFKGLGADLAPAKLLPILGGDGKGQDFAPLLAPLLQHARAVALIGRDAARLAELLREPAAAAGIPVQQHDGLPQATRWAFEQAHAGDAVLLSPACASLDMFRNYAHRAEVFVHAVRALADERGEWLS